MDISLHDFIEQNMDTILREWEEFARGNFPSEGQSVRVLRDHAEGILRAIVRDMRKDQSSETQAAKSRGDLNRSGKNSAEDHATERLDLGYDINQLGAEFRALRASVTRLWSERLGSPGPEAFDQLIRFNEAMDQELFDSVREYAEELGRSRKMFLAILGHDLGSPLGAIAMSVELMRYDKGLSDGHKKALTRIRHSTAQMKQMITDLLDATHLSLNGSIPVHPETTRLDEICRRVADQCRAFHPDSTVELEMNGNLEGVWDPARLTQVLTNLLENAIKHGDPKKPVRFEVEGMRESVRLKIHNEGEIIPEQLREKIFDPLFSVERGSSNSGLGLGLFIARSIISDHQGTIEVESSSAHGTTFAVCLPRRSAEAG